MEHYFQHVQTVELHILSPTEGVMKSKSLTLEYFKQVCYGWKLEVLINCMAIPMFFSNYEVV